MPRIVFAAIMLLAVGLAGRGITDEAAVRMGGDMSRYAMNGVFVHDLVAEGGAWSYDDLVSRAEHYYARYPALSLGHHPPLPYIALVPFYAVFGVSMFAARLSALLFFVVAVWQLYAFARRNYGWQVASWTALLFVTNLYVLRSAQSVLSEIPMLALVLAAVNLLDYYCSTGNKKHFAWFVIAAAASLYAKQLAVFMFPVYVVMLATRLGWTSLLRRHVMVLSIFGAVLLAPLGAMTLALAPANVHLVAWNITHVGTDRGLTVPEILARIIREHLSTPVIPVVVAGAVALLLRRDRRGIVPMAWMLFVLGGTVVIAAGIEPGRYAFGVMPVYFLLAASLVAHAPSPALRWVVVAVLASSALWQVWLIRDVRPSGAGGYEAAAQYVIDERPAPVILFDSPIDTGNFVFFVRKHDPTHRLVVLRAEQLLVTRHAEGIGSGSAPPDIYASLRKFGIQFVVVEERPNQHRSLQLLEDELKTNRFVARQRIPIASRDREMAGVDLVVYEFKDWQPAEADAELDIDVRIGRRRIRMPLSDLIGDGVR